ncbi:MAG: hypothetical protein ACRDKA_15005 [Actinomycetota bacterium]
MELEDFPAPKEGFVVTHFLVVSDQDRSRFISARTAEHHVQHVYTKIGTSTRASAAVFAMQHGLLRS